MDIVSYVKSKGYTDETVIGGGAIKGKNCVVESIQDTGTAEVVTFKWTLDDGTVQRQAMTVKHGVSPEITVKEDTPARYVLHIKTEDAEWDTPNLRGGGSGSATDYDALDNKPQINGITLTGNMSAADLSLDQFKATYNAAHESVTIQI